MKSVMGVLTEDVRAALTAGRLAHLVTLNQDGSPQVTIVGGSGWTVTRSSLPIHMHESQKVRNLRRDPRVALSMETGGRNTMGLDHYLVVYGTAQITEGGAPELLQRLAEIYRGPGVQFPPPWMTHPPGSSPASRSTA